jgi:ABC-type antimicrobial peptide transport system permease subunit
MTITMIIGMLMWVGPQVASAKQAQQLSTCLNLATGANRVLVRGACDAVLEMTQVWDQVSVDEPVGKFFSARTLALAVLLNTGGDVSKFTKKDWVSLARLIRAEFMKHKGRDYVVAASALGAGNFRKIFLHITPNVLHIIIISFSLRFVTAIKSEVVLTYLGLGAQTGSASWGLMIQDNQGVFMQGYWGGLVGVTVAMFFICLAFSMFSDALRDAFDPKIRT